jgi:hypothetical protein
MYRGRLWTMRQYAGFGTAAESTNQRFKFLLAAGQTGLSCAFDLPTQMGYDSDHPRAEGEVGKVGVAIDSIEDMRVLLDGPAARQGHHVDDHQLDGGHPAADVRAGGRGAGRELRAISGTIQNDLLKEYIARGTYVYPPRRVDAADHRHLRLLQRARPEVEHDLDLRLPHPRGRLHGGAGDRLHARQRHRLRAGGGRRRPRRRRVRPPPELLLERPQQLLRGGGQVPGQPAHVVQDHDRAVRRQRRSKLLRFHTQTGGSTLTAQQPRTTSCGWRCRRWPP